ncbi:hypothetical protein FACS1894161_2360 [Spirochaetia bacterium]|nr:hypothetical protein FACS1894161_2360 [Spirochaetia bacterium]
MEETTITNKALLLGDNDYFETGLINIGAGVEIKEGAFLRRNGTRFAVVTDTDTQEPVAILPVAIKNTKNAAADFSVRASLGGKVRADMLHVNGVRATADQIDMIKDTETLVYGPSGRINDDVKFLVFFQDGKLLGDPG